jgi:hypothetical protein
VPRSGRSRPRATEIDLLTCSITCVADGRAHRVPDVQLAAPDAAHDGVYRALCGHVVLAGSLVEPDGAPCALCAERQPQSSSPGR